MRVEACGICPTDVRKYAIGTRDGYPLNPGHEWVGEVVEVGPDATEWSVGQRVCGDTYAGYAEYAVLSVEPARGRTARWRFPAISMRCVRRSWSRSPTASTRCTTRRACGRGSRVCIVGAGQMGLQMVAVAAAAGADVTVVEPHAERRALAGEFGAAQMADGPELAEAAARQRGRDPHDRSRGARRDLRRCRRAGRPRRPLRRLRRGAARDTQPRCHPLSRGEPRRQRVDRHASRTSDGSATPMRSR